MGGDVAVILDSTEIVQLSRGQDRTCRDVPDQHLEGCTDWPPRLVPRPVYSPRASCTNPLCRLRGCPCQEREKCSLKRCATKEACTRVRASVVGYNRFAEEKVGFRSEERVLIADLRIFDERVP